MRAETWDGEGSNLSRPNMSDLAVRVENRINGAILGMRWVEIGRKFDEIVAFSEVERFLDTPVKRYASGMHVRLAFVVAAHPEPGDPAGG